MLDATARWSLSNIIIALVFGNCAGGMALMLGVPLLGSRLGSHPKHVVRDRVAGGALTLLGLAGWVVPWLIIIHWLGRA